MGCLVSIFTIGINSKSFPRPVHPVHETYPKFSATSDAGLRHKAGISQSQAASDDRLLSHVTLDRIECRKWTASADTQCFEPNTVLWAFHTIQPS